MGRARKSLVQKLLRAADSPYFELPKAWHVLSRWVKAADTDADGGGADNCVCCHSRNCPRTSNPHPLTTKR